MALTKLSKIPLWKPPQNEDPDAAGPIGRISLVDAVTLTKVFIDDSQNGKMKVMFGAEQEGFQLWRGRPLEVRTKDTPLANARRLMTIEVATNNKDHKGRTVVISFVPSSSDWFGWSTFKSVSHNPAGPLRELLDAAFKAPPSQEEIALWAKLCDLETDPFGNEKTIYARFRQLERADSIADTDRYYDEEDRISVRGSKTNRKVQEPELTLGICDFDRCRSVLNMSPLLEETLDRAQQQLLIRDHKGDDVQITPTAQSLAPELMEAAIVKALSGVGPEDRASLERDKNSSIHGPVAVHAKRIFEQDIYNLSKRTSKEGKIIIDEMPAIEGSVSSQRPERASSLTRDDIEACIRKYAGAIKMNLFRKSDSWLAVLQMLRAHADEVLAVDDRIPRACLYAAAMARHSPMPDNVIERLRQWRKDYPLFVEAALGHCHGGSCDAG